MTRRRNTVKQMGSRGTVEHRDRETLEQRKTQILDITGARIKVYWNRKKWEKWN